MTTRYLQFGAVAVVVALTVASLPAGALSTTAPVQFQQDGLPEVTFDDQTSDGTSVTVAAASNDTTPYYTAVWTLDDNGTPETLLGATQVTTNTADNVSVEFDESVDESQTLIAAVHPDTDGDASTVDPDTETILASDTANVTVEQPVTGASFAVSDLEAPSTTSSTVPVVVTATVSNPNDEAATQSIAYRVNGSVQARQQLSLDSGESTQVSFTLDPSEFDPGEYVHGVYTEESSLSAPITISSTDSFEVESVDTQDTAVVGEGISVTANVSNPNVGDDEQPVEVWLDGERVEQVNVTIAGGSTETVEFTAVDGDLTPGEYEVGVFTRDDGQFATVTVDSVSPDATVTFENQTTNGSTVTVASTTLPEGGFVTIHNASLLDGDAVGSVVGVSEYLEPGASSDVTVTLFNGTVTESQTLIAMPHLDTNDNETYDFVTSGGVEDIPYVDSGGDPVVDDAEVTFEEEPEPSVTFDDQTSDGTSVTVAAASNTTTPYYTAVWTLDDNGTPETLLGATQATETTVDNVSVEFDESINESQTLIAAVHPDIDGNASTVDPDTETILASDTANVTVEAGTETPTETATETPTETTTSTPTETATEAPTETATSTPTQTATETPTQTATETPTQTATETPTQTATSTPTQTATETPTQTATSTPTQTATETPTQTATSTPAQTATATATETLTGTPTATLAPGPTSPPGSVAASQLVTTTAF